MESSRLKKEKNGLQHDSSLRNRSYMARGNYRSQLNRLLKWFPSDQLLVLTFDELRDAHNQTLCKVFRFLGVDDRFVIPQRTVFPSKGWKPSNWQRYLLKLVFFRHRREYGRVVKDWLSFQKVCESDMIARKPAL